MVIFHGYVSHTQMVVFISSVESSMFGGMLAHTRGCVVYTSTRILEIASSIVVYGLDMSWLSMNINGIPTWISDRFYEPDWTCVSAARYMVNNGSNNHRASHSVVRASHQITSHHITSHIELSIYIYICVCVCVLTAMWYCEKAHLHAKCWYRMNMIGRGKPQNAKRMERFCQTLWWPLLSRRSWVPCKKLGILAKMCDSQ